MRTHFKIHYGQFNTVYIRLNRFIIWSVTLVFLGHVHLLLPVYQRYTVLPAESDSDFMFVYKFIRDLLSIDHLRINPIHRIGLIRKWSID